MQGGRGPAASGETSVPKGQGRVCLCGWWLEEKQRGMGYKEQGGGKPTCDCNPGGISSDFPLEALWLEAGCGLRGALCCVSYPSPGF